MFDDSLVEYGIEVSMEETPVRGNAMFSDDADYVRKVENDIIESLSRGNVWAWASVKVTARYPGIPQVTGVDYLGCCSYESQEDFEKDFYYEDMLDNARNDLFTQLESIAIILRRAESEDSNA